MIGRQFNTHSNESFPSRGVVQTRISALIDSGTTNWPGTPERSRIDQQPSSNEGFVLLLAVLILTPAQVLWSGSHPRRIVMRTLITSVGVCVEIERERPERRICLRYDTDTGDLPDAGIPVDFGGSRSTMGASDPRATEAT